MLDILNNTNKCECKWNFNIESRRYVKKQFKKKYAYANK